MARSIESISHALDPLAEALLPKRRAQYYRSVAQVITPDGRVRADKLDGFVPPDKVPTIGLEYVGDAVADLDFPSIAAGTCAELAVTVDGAQTGDGVILGPSATLTPNLAVFGYVNAADSVRVRACNPTGSAIDPAVKSFRIWVVR